MEDLRRLPANKGGNESPDTNESKSHGEEDDSLLAALPVVRLIASRKSFSGGQSDALDFVQAVIVRLLGWLARHEDKANEMLREDWESYAARAAYNETKRHYAREKRRHESFDEANEIARERDGVTGETAAEFDSLARAVWQEICRMTIRQRRALLLHSRNLIVDILTSGVEEEELLEVLEISADDLREIAEKLPLSNEQIAALDKREKGETRITEKDANNVKKARFEARAKIRKIIAK